MIDEEKVPEEGDINFQPDVNPTVIIVQQNEGININNNPIRERVYEPTQEFSYIACCTFFSIVFQGISVTVNRKRGCCCKDKRKWVFSSNDLLMVQYEPGMSYLLHVGILLIISGILTFIFAPNALSIGLPLIFIGISNTAIAIYFYIQYVTLRFVVRDVKSMLGSTYYIPVVFPTAKANEVRRFMLKYYNQREKFNPGTFC